MGDQKGEDKKVSVIEGKKNGITIEMTDAKVDCIFLMKIIKA